MKNVYLKAILGGASFAALPAFALDSAVSTALTSAFATVVTDATALSALVMVPIVGILAVSLIIKLVKRFGNKV